MNNGVYSTRKSYKLVKFRQTVATVPKFFGSSDERMHADAVGLVTCTVEGLLDAISKVNEVVLIRNEISGPEIQFDTNHVWSFVRYDFAIAEGSGRRRMAPGFKGDEISVIEDQSTITIEEKK